MECQEGTFISLGADPDIAHNIAQQVCHPQNRRG